MSLRCDQLIKAFLCRKLFWLIINDLYDNRTWVSNLGANKLPPKNVLFRRLEERGILWYSIQHLSFTLNHKLVCALFVSYQPSDNLKKSSFQLFQRRHFNKAPRTHDGLSHAIIMTILWNRGSMLQRFRFSERLQCRIRATCPTPVCGIKWPRALWFFKSL